MAALDGNVKIPGLGEVPKKYVLLGGGAAGIIVIVVLVRRRQSAAASAAAPAAAGADQYPADGTVGDPSDPYSTDPATGITYGDEQGSAGLASGFDDSGGFDAAGYPIGSAADEAYQSGGGGSVTGSSGTGLPATNSDWVAAALADLPGGDSSANEAAINGVLAGLTVTTAQANIFNQAVSLVGESPPQGYPQPVKTSDTAGQPGGGNAGAPSTPVVTTAPTGFRVVSVTGANNVNLAWNAAKGATGYVIAYGPTAGSQQYKQGVGGGGTTAATVAGVGGGPAGTHYFELWATPARTGGPHAGPISVHVPGNGAKPATPVKPTAPKK